MGFSLGSNILAKYIGEEGKKCIFKSAISVCNPYNFCTCYHQMKTVLFGLYDKFLTQSIIERHRRNIDVFKSIGDPNIPIEDALAHTQTLA